MRLIDTETLGLKEFMGEVPKYAILSHTWGAKELTYGEFLDRTNWKGDCFDKIRATCREASNRGIRYAWVDTCCIDKTSSSELSEAINSMFRWYEESEVCFAFLVDVVRQQGTPGVSFESSRWFTRGWTLQELLAPRKLDFFDANWAPLGSRRNLSSRISSITRINETFLLENTVSSRQRLLQEASIAERMSWAADRVTTREEDVAYCLLGILGVNMPLIYGEGVNAFMRLQAEVISHCFDPSLLAWNAIRKGVSLPPEKSPKYARWRSAYNMITWAEHPWSSAVAIHKKEIEWFQSGISPLALSPRYFLSAEDIGVGDVSINWSATSQGLEITLPISQNIRPYLLLPCYLSDDPTSLVAIPLLKQDDGTYLRACTPTRLVGRQKWHQWERKTVVLRTKRAVSSVHYNSRVKKCDIFIRSIPSGLRIKKTYVDGILTPHSQSRTATGDPASFLRSTNGTVAISFEAKSSSTPVVLGIQQVPDESGDLFSENHDRMRLSCSFETTDTFKSMASKQPGSRPRPAREYLRLGSGILHTRVIPENTVSQRVFLVDIILSTGTFHQFFLRIRYDMKAWFQRLTSKPIATDFKRAAFMVGESIPAIKYVNIVVGATVLVCSAVAYLGMDLCSNAPEWFDHFAKSAPLILSFFCGVLDVVSLSTLAVQLLPIVCCFWPQTSYFLRKYGWIIAAVIGIVIRTLKPHIFVRILQRLQFPWAMCWRYATGNAWTGDLSFEALLVFDWVIILTEVGIGSLSYLAYGVCSVQEVQSVDLSVLHDQTNFLGSISKVSRLVFFIVVRALWLAFKHSRGWLN